MSRTRGLALLLGLVLAWLLPLQAVRAHKASDAFLHLQLDGAHVQQRLDIALRDMDRELALDGDDDGQLSWGEVRARWPDIEALAGAALQLRRGGQACQRGVWLPARLETHTDGRHAVLRTSWLCEKPGELSVDYRLFQQSDPTHRGILRVLDAQQQVRIAAAVLVPGAQPLVVEADGGPDAATQPTQNFPGFVAEGLHHIAAGLDHVLFLATLLVVAVWRREGRGWVPRRTAGGAWRESLVLVTSFTLAHSMTLALAASGVLAPPSRWVESLIAVSVLVAAVDNLRPFLPGPRWMVVGAFGLVHGFGLAGPLQDLGLRGTSLVLPLLGFNLGVEAGQLVIVALLLPLAICWRDSPLYRRAVVQGGSFSVALLAGVWTLQRSLDLGALGP